MRRSANMHFSYLLLADEALGHGDIYQKIGQASLINLEFMHTQSSSYLTMTTLADGALLDKNFFSFSQIMHEYFVNIAWLTKLHATKADSSIPEKVTMQISGRQK